MPVNFMTLGIVVAMTTHIRIVTTRGDQAASAHVVLATNHFFCFFFIGHICGKYKQLRNNALK
jgi:hypothetical protein